MRDKFQVTSLKSWNKIYGTREKNTINILDMGFKGLSITQSECICGGRGFRLPRHIEYVHNKPNWNGITYFTDKFISRKAIGRIKSKIKVAILTEPRDLQPEMYNNIESCIDLVDVVLTHDNKLLNKFPKKCRFFICSCPILSYGDINLHAKTKLVSMTFSNKKHLSGHALRYEIYDNLQADGRFKFVDYYGDGVGKYTPEKSTTLKEYMYSIVIENNKKDFYFTEKIFDCFASGNVPIYWGCPSIGNYFDINGIHQFDTIDELKSILLQISESKYNNMTKSIAENFRLVNENFMDPDDVAFFTVIDFLKEKKLHKDIYEHIL